MKNELKRSLTQIARISMQKTLLLEKYILSLRHTTCDITALLKEKNVCVRKLRDLSLKVIRDDEENCILIDEVMQLCKEKNIDEDLSESQSSPIPVKRSDGNSFQRKVPKQVECITNVLPLATAT